MDCGRTDIVLDSQVTCPGIATWIVRFTLHKVS